MQIFLVGCGSASVNQLNRDSFILRDGYFHGRPLKTQMVFKRFSWFKEASLMYELRLAPLSEESSYFQWLSPQTQSDVRECPRFYIGMLYSKSSDYIPHRLVKNQLEGQGARMQVVPGFWRSFKMHPQFEREALQRHRLRGICFKRAGGAIILGLPGYPSEIILE